MAVSALNVEEIAKIKEIASEYKLSVADFVRDAVRYYVEYAEALKAKKEMIRQRLANLEPADPEESAEILAYIESMTPEDHEIVRVDTIYV